MRITICAMGRAKSGPEAALIDDYRTRFDRTGRALGLGPLTITEIDDRKGGGMGAEATLLTKAAGTARLITLDERGDTLTSPAFAKRLASWRDDGQGEIAFLIGGAEGLDPNLRSQAIASISLGKMVWPHMLARVMLTEQLYRAATILAGTPYHKA
ncbi:MAG: 23S rRNA (pseudouridine(1915)-N(3))-methyltransferase RlmH [Shimia sp.]